jgi:dienelactone hydrolase
MKARMREALGELPERTPLNPRVVGREGRDGYRIEKVIYESRPGHHVTATLYLPEGPAPSPGVLMPIGHSIEGKAAEYVQRGAILLARHGLAVLAYDPIGQGERRQLLDERGRPVLSGSTTEHTMAGVGALLVGRSTASYRVWDGMRSLDYLAGRPEIDPRRLGCTGCSGGGTETAYLMALDDRVAVAAPSCYITSLERLFETIGPQDAEQNLTGQVAFGLEHADYITLRAPSPTLLCAATRDFFDIQGTWTSFREAKRAYGLLGHGERVDLFESDTTHGFPRPQREAVVRWMRRWLLKIDDAPEEQDVAIASEADLRCTRTGQVLTEFDGRSVFDLTAERARELATVRAEARADRRREGFLEEVGRLIAAGTPSRGGGDGGRRPAARGDSHPEAGLRDRPGHHGAGPALQPGGRRARADRGVRRRRREGRGRRAGRTHRVPGPCRPDVLAVDLRGFGETAPGVRPAIGRASSAWISRSRSSACTWAAPCWACACATCWPWWVGWPRTAARRSV